MDKRLEARKCRPNKLKTNHLLRQNSRKNLHNTPASYRTKNNAFIMTDPGLASIAIFHENINSFKILFGL